MGVKDYKVVYDWIPPVDGFGNGFYLWLLNDPSTIAIESDREGIFVLLSPKDFFF